MKTLIENYINGNITTARKQAKRHGLGTIRRALEEDFGFSALKSALVAIFLKTGEGWQASCDAE